MIKPKKKEVLPSLGKCPTGIRGFDEITGGGLPEGRPTLLCGGAGSGKTLLAMEFLVRGAMVYSSQIREFVITDKGIDLIDVYAGPGGVLTGTARMIREAEEKAARLMRDQEVSAKKRELDRRRKALEARIAILHAGFEAEEEALKKAIGEAESREKDLGELLKETAKARGKD